MRKYVLPCELFIRCLLGGYLLEVVDDLGLSGQVVSDLFVSVDQDEDPLLDDVGVESVLLVVHERLDQLLESADSDVLVFVRDVEQLLEEKEELSVALGLELLQPSVQEFNQGLKKLFIAFAEMG